MRAIDNMRILIISYFFPPLHAVASLRPGSWARTWVEMGHEVTVLTVPKDGLPVTSGRPMPAEVAIAEVKIPKSFHRFRAVHRNRIWLSSTPGTCSNEPSLIKRLVGRLDDYRMRKGIFATIRMPDLTDLWVKPALRWARYGGDWDVIVSTSGPYATHLIAARLKKERLTRFWVADYRDLWTDSPTHPGLFPFTLIEKSLERWAMKHADLLVTVSRSLAETLKRKYGSKRVEVIENGFDLLDLTELNGDAIFPADDKIRIVYTGSLSKGSRDPGPLFDAVSRLSQNIGTRYLLDRLEIIFCGPSGGGLHEVIETYRVDRWVRQIGLVPRPDALRMQRDAHALLFMEWDMGGVDGILTGKLFEYISSGTPIWGVGVTKKTETGKLIQKTRTGMLFGDDVSHIARELTRLLASGKKEPVQAVPHAVARFERGYLAKRLMMSISERMPT